MSPSSERSGELHLFLSDSDDSSDEEHYIHQPNNLISDTESEMSDANDPSYVPSDAESESDLEQAQQVCNSDPIAKAVLNTSPSTIKSKPSQAGQQKLSHISTNPPLEPRPNTAQTYVLSSTSTAEKRKWSKYVYCMYCNTKQTKLRRHLQRKHKDEMLVAQACAMKEINHQKAEEVWTEIRNIGNHRHNLNVHEGKESDLIVKKLPTKGSNADIVNFVPCSDCLAYFRTESLWRHKRNCTKGKKKPQGGRTLKAARKLIPLRNETTEIMREVLETMQQDKIALVVKNDPFIIRIGQRAMNQSNTSRKGDIAREKMRTAAKLLVLCREKETTIANAGDLPLPKHFNSLVAATREMSGYDASSATHNHYSTAMRVGHVITDLAIVVRNQLIKDGLHSRKQLVDEFLQLKEGEWREMVTASALQQRQSNSWTKPKLLPLTKDVQKFSSFLKRERAAAGAHYPNLTKEQYKRLAHVTLAEIVLFNRRRPQEVQNLTIQQYENTRRDNSHEEIYQELSTSEKMAIDRLKVVMVRGKRGRGVPILLTEDIQTSVQQLVDHNNKRGTKYVFSRTREDSSTPFRASSAMRILADEAELVQPMNMRCTKLRKHLATMTQVLNLNEEELEQLANHMGHDVATHREYYRLPTETILLSKVSKILRMADKGLLLPNSGKKLSDINVRPDDDVDLDTDTDESDDDSSSESSSTSGSPSLSGQSPPNPSSNLSTMRRKLHAPATCKERKNMGNGRKYIRWSEEEETYLNSSREAKQLLAMRKVPGKTWCEELISKSGGILSNKSWKEIKNKVHNIITREKARMMRKELNHRK